MTKKRTVAVSVIFSVLLAISIVLGGLLKYRGYTANGFVDVVRNIIIIIVVAAVLTVLLVKIFRYFILRCEKESESVITQYTTKNLIIFFSKIFAIIFICWLPVWLAYFPTIFSYDIDKQIGEQIVLGNYTTFHPLIHTLWMGSCFNFMRAEGSRTIGMALYSFTQIILLDACIAYAVTYMKQKNVSRVWKVISVIFFGLFPVNPILAISTTKDVLFAGLVLVFIIVNIQLMEDVNIKNFRIIEYIIITVLMLLFRNNAFYAFVLSAIIQLICLKDRRKVYAVLAISSIAIYLLCGAGLKAATNATGGDIREALGIPLQQMARVGKLTGETNEYIDEEIIRRYNASNVDSVKLVADGELIKDDLGKFAVTWLTTGLKHPVIYTDAFLQNTLGYWYLGDVSHSQIYGVGDGYGYLQSGRDKITWLMEWNGGIKLHSFIPGLKVIYDNLFINNEYQKIPGMTMLFCPAFYVWIYLFCIAFNIIKRRYKLLVPSLFLLCYLFTLLLGPCVLIRYAYPIAISVPILIGLTFGTKSTKLSK